MHEEFAVRELTIDGVRTAIKVIGRGPPVLFLHGASTLEGWDALKPLGTHFTVYAPSHPGFGLSGDAPHLTSMGDLVVHYRALIGALELERPHLIGFSMGGWLAAELAAMCGERFNKLVLVAPAGLRDTAHPMTDLAAIPPQDFPAFLSDNAAIAGHFFPDGQNKPATEAFVEARSREGEAVARLTRPFGFGHPNLARWLGHVTNPCLISWGEKDRIIPAESARLWRAALPHAAFASYSDAGHLVLLEAAEAVTTISNFLKN